jgi:hypothetical protein
VWESIYHTTDYAARETMWTVVEISTGRRLEVAERPGDMAGYFPYWSDAHRLSLEKGSERTIFDTSTGQLAKPLIGYPQEGVRYRDIDDWLSPYVGECRQEYIDRHYARELRALESALKAFGRELGVSNYLREQEGSMLPDVPADMLLRPLGLVYWGGPGRSKLIWPSVAISSDLSMLARTVFVPTGRQMARSLQGDAFFGYTFEARIDVYELPSGPHLWGKSVPQRLPQARDVAYYFGHAGVAWVLDPWFKDPRWSSDGRYLVFVTREEPTQRQTVNVLDTSSWKIVLQIEDVTDAFIVPAPAASGEERGGSK